MRRTRAQNRVRDKGGAPEQLAGVAGGGGDRDNGADGQLGGVAGGGGGVAGGAPRTRSRNKARDAGRVENDGHGAIGAIGAPGAARQRKSAKAKSRGGGNLRRSISTPNLDDGNIII